MSKRQRKIDQMVLTETGRDNWQPIKGFPGYSVNPLGQVRRDDTKRLLHTRLNQYRVPYVGLMKGDPLVDRRQYLRSLPKLVAQTFLSPPNEIFDTPIQLDGNPQNCRVDNLMWRPRWYAVLYKQQFVEPYDRPINEPVRAVNERERFPNSFEAACRYGLLEREVVLSIVNRTVAWPTYQEFELVRAR